MSRIMVVEDEPVTAADLEQRLTALGHDVSWLDSGEEAVARAPALEPELVLMDIRLRGSLSGIDAARLMREQRDVPIVFVTAFADQETVDRACATQPHGYLLKPFSERSVATAVQVALTRADAERTRLERERWIESALQGAGDAVIAMDETAAIRFINARAEKLLNVRAQDVLGSDARVILHFATDELGDSTQPIDLALHEDRWTSSAKRALLRVSGAPTLQVSYSAAPVHVAGIKAGAVLILHEPAHDLLPDDPDALVALDQLSRRLAHEINNPLTYNLGSLHIARDELDQLRAVSALGATAGAAAASEREAQLLRVLDLLRTAEEGGSRIASIVREMKSFSLSERDRAPIQPTELFELAIGLSRVGAADHVRLVTQIEPAPIVKGNKWQLAGVLAYALRNAIHTLERRSAREMTLVTAVSTDERGWAKFSVTAHAQTASDSRAARKQSSAPSAPASPTTVSGNLAEQVIHSHGGELVIVDRPAGHSIELYLPPMSVATPFGGIAAAQAVPERRASVLVVDDEPMIRRALEITLRPDHDVTAVTSPQRALDLLARGDAFDVVLYDFSLPGMPGSDFYTRLRALRPQSAERVIFMTGGALGELDAPILQQPNARTLEKPFTTDQLLSRVAECMATRAQA
jgi:two-component system cell cycle sensor histidine kinase/response regulator CckA